MSQSAGPRQARVERRTKETEVRLALALDGTGASTIGTTIPFLDHMLDAWARHGLFDLEVEARGDTDVDLHHTVEDVGIVLGRAFREALGDRRGIVRFGTAFVPMDETLVSASVDISGRPFLVYGLPLWRARVGSFDVDLVKEFVRAFVVNAELTLHVTLHAGENLHHIAEAVFKALARALGDAVRIDPRVAGRVPSTKGSL